MRNLARRIAAVSEALSLDEDDGAPRGIVYELAERSFRSRAELVAWSAKEDRGQRAARGPVEVIRITTVSVCGPGEEPAARDLGRFREAPGDEPRSMAPRPLVPIEGEA